MAFTRQHVWAYLSLFHRMKNCIFIFIIITLLCCECTAQIYVEPIIGFQSDIGNKAGFKQINSGVQFGFKLSRGYELVLRIQESWGLPYHSTDSSFSLNPALPLYTSANKTIHSGVLYFSADHRFALNRNNKKHLFSILLHTGISAQKLTVDYQYDKNNYIILNPDKTQKLTGVFIGTGFEYMRLFRDSRLFLQLTLDGAPSGNMSQYPSSFSFMTPLAINAGYSILI